MPRKTKFTTPDFIGQRFNLLTVIAIHKTKHDTKWECRCECGSITTTAAYHVYGGKTTSCGCFWLKRITKHGMNRQAHKSPEYQSWASMHSRVNNAGRKEFENYGGRGITVCARWDDFGKFYADMGPRPSPKHSIDRIDNNGNYEPGNCRWATSEEQNRNTRRNVWITYNEQTHCIAEWAKMLGITASVLRYRLRRWGVAESLTTPKLLPTSPKMRTIRRILGRS